MKPLLTYLAVGYVAYAVIMVAFHPRLIYPFQPDDRVLAGFTRNVLQGNDGTEISVQERVGAGPVVLYFMGNAGSLAFFEQAFAAHVAADRHVVAMEYRGGGGRPGTPSETRLKTDALTVADYALGFDKPLIVQGFSLGTGLALHVAASREVDRVVLTAPYDRLCRLMMARSWLPACILPFVQRWNAYDMATEVNVPMLVLHGAEDALIPPSYSAAFRTLSPVSYELIEGAGHNDIGSFPAHGAAIAAFLEPLN